MFNDTPAIRDKYRDYIPGHTGGSRDGNYVACATVFPPDTVISMRLNHWNRLKIQLHPNILFIQTHFRVSMPGNTP